MQLFSPFAALAGLALSALFSASPVHAQGAVPPVAAVRNVTDTFFGTTVDDPYRYFENKNDPEVMQWMKAHNEHARKALARIPGRDALLEKIQRYDASVSDRVGQLQRMPGDLYFTERRAVKDNQYKLYVRRGLTGTDKLLVDPEALEKRTGKPHAINWYTPSPDGKYVAYGLSKGGSEAAVLNVIDTRTGRTVGAPIDRADFGGVDWSPDGKLMVFNRLQALRKGMPETQKYQHSQVLALKLGRSISSALPLFGTAIKGLDIGPVDLPFVQLTHDGRWALGYAINGTQREQGLFVTPQAAFLAGKPKWTRVLKTDDAVTGSAYFDDTLYLVTYKGAARSQVLALKIDARDLSAAQVIVPPSDRVVVNVVAAADALYIETRDGNVKRLFKRAYAPTASVVEVALPVEGSFELTGDGITTANPRLSGLVIDLQSWNRARQIFAVGADGSITNTQLQPSGPFDAPADIVATEVKVRSHDGAMVPMSIIHRKGVRLTATTRRYSMVMPVTASQKSRSSA